MTNKDKIQEQHFIKILSLASNDTLSSTVKEAATSCTTITAEAIGDWEKWKQLNGYSFIDGICYDYPNYKAGISVNDLVQLFLNQKAKI